MADKPKPTKEERRAQAEESHRLALAWYAERGLEPLILSVDNLKRKPVRIKD